MSIKTVRLCKHIRTFIAFHLPLSLIMWYVLELEHSFQAGSEAKYYRVSIPSICQQIQTGTKNYKYKRRSIRLSNGIINSLQWKAVEIKTYCCRIKAHAWKFLPHCSSSFYQSFFLQTCVQKAFLAPQKAGYINWPAKSQLSKIKLVLSLKLKNSTPRCDLQSTNCTASAACWKKWLCLSLHNVIPKGWTKNNPSWVSTAAEFSP